MNLSLLKKHPRKLRKQRGVVLIIALIVLVAMTLAGIGMMRSVDTGSMIAGNLAFTQGAIHGGDRGVEAGITWLTGQSAATLQQDQNSGYFANWQDNFNPSTFDWANLATQLAADSSGNTVSFVVHRMCNVSNASVNAPNQTCVKLQAAGSGGSQGGGAYGSLPLSNTWQVYYRITARTVGPKNTVSYVQVMLY